MAKTCEWMFADVGTGVLGFQELAHLDPLRWSGTLSLDQGVSDLKEVQAKGNRPIRLKVPAGVFNRDELIFDIVQEAINHLESRTTSDGSSSSPRLPPSACRTVDRELAEAESALDEAESARKAAEERLVTAEEEVASAEAVCSSAIAEKVGSTLFSRWRYGEVAMTPFGWSSVQSLDRTVADLDGVASRCSRPICVLGPTAYRVVLGMGKRFQDPQGAIDYLRATCPRHQMQKARVDEASTALQRARERRAGAEAQLAEARQREADLTAVVAARKGAGA